jgi:AraC-like DNA-binding protein
LLCGSFRFGQGDGHPLIAVLPPLICIKGQEGRPLEWLDLTLRFLASETRRPRAGSDSMVTRLTELLFVQIVRAWIEEQPEGHGGWLGALRDGRIARVLGLMHGEPGRAWSVPTLARAAGMSRATLARRFTSLVGEAPLTYLSRWRMHVAAGLLRSHSLSVAEAAARVGYQSEAAFSRVFRKVVGVAPAAYRRAALPARP